MSGYSKIRVARNKKSRSIDFSDLFSSCQNPKSITNPYLDLNSKTQLPNQNIHFQTKITTHDSIAEVNDEEEEEEQEGDEDVDGERSGVILSRNYSVSSSIPNHQKLKADQKQKPTLHQSSLMRRAFSMRRSSSVAEEYYRIHEQLDPISSSPPPPPLPTTANEEILTKSKKSKKVKILKVCKRILGF